MIHKLFARRSYITWEEYIRKITLREGVFFMSNTAEKSIDNYWKKRRRYYGI